MRLIVLSAGAAKGLVGDIAPLFAADGGIAGSFNAVGAIRERFLGGEACDVLILTARQLDELAIAGRIVAGSVAPIGTVRTAVAVPTGQALPDISTGAALAAALRAASAIHVPDPYKSTAGIHVLSVITALGLAAELEPRLRAFPNGETAMRILAEEAQAGAIGSTQMTEIRYTRGLTLVGPLPPGYELSTIYSAAITTNAADPAAASRLVAALTGPVSADLRRRSGFE